MKEFVTNYYFVRNIKNRTNNRSGPSRNKLILNEQSQHKIVLRKNS